MNSPFTSRPAGATGVEEPPEAFSDGASLAVDVPELVSFSLDVATIGSRFLAMAVDLVLRVVAVLGLVTVYVLLDDNVFGPMEGDVADAVQRYTLLGFLLFGILFWFGYFVLFEVLQSGRTPGKRLLKLRVVTDVGGPVGWTESLIRNVLRAVDSLPMFYGVGFLTMLLNRRSQRVGDLAAGTIVIRDSQVQKTGPLPLSQVRVPMIPRFPLPERPPLSARAHDILMSYFGRHWEFSEEGRQRLAKALVAYLWPDHVAALSQHDPELVLWNFIAEWQERQPAEHNGAESAIVRD